MSDYLNGPALVEWLEENRPNPLCSETQTGTCRDFLGHDDRRKLRYWRSGVNPSVFSADVVLVRLNVHLSELPDELFITKSERNRLKKGVAA